MPVLACQLLWVVILPLPFAGDPLRSCEAIDSVGFALLASGYTVHWGVCSPDVLLALLPPCRFCQLPILIPTPAPRRPTRALATVARRSARAYLTSVVMPAGDSKPNLGRQRLKEHRLPQLLRHRNRLLRSHLLLCRCPLHIRHRQAVALRHPRPRSPCQ